MNAIESAVWDFVDKHFNPNDVKQRNGQVLIRECPFCKGGQSHDEFTFAIGLHNGAYNCMRANGCNVRGTFRQLLRHYGDREPEEVSFVNMYSQKQSKQKIWDKPDPDMLKPVTDEIISFFGTRKISEQTIKDWKIASDKHGNIVFPFYRNDVLEYVKFRQPRSFKKIREEYEEKKAELKKKGKDKEADELHKPSKEWQIPNTAPILFGMDMVSFNKPLVITEGEMDTLALYEAGVTNAVSVPCGAENKDWISLCYDWLENFNQIILFGDSDQAGLAMMSYVAGRLGQERCMIPQEYPEFIHNGKDENRICKDANEILYCYGPEVLKSIVDACEPAPVKGLLDVSEINFVDPSVQPKILSKIPDLDQMIGGFMEGGVTVISGRRGEGKSTIGNTIMLNAIQQGYKCAVYSGELDANTFTYWLMLTCTESKYISYREDPNSGKNFCMIDDEIEKRIKEWLRGKMFLFDNGEIFDEDVQTAVLKCFEVAARRYGVQLFLIDNLMSLLTSNDEENKAQARFMARVKAFASKYKVHVLCVCHPRKEKEGTTFSNDSVSGSSVLTNLADNVLSIERPHIRVTKNRHFGVQGFIPCVFDPCNRRIFQASTGDKIVYGWDHEGIQKPEKQAKSLPEFSLETGAEDPTENRPI